MKLSSLRAKVDRLDDQLVRLLEQRAEIAHEIGRQKLESGQAVSRLLGKRLFSVGLQRG